LTLLGVRKRKKEPFGNVRKVRSQLPQRLRTPHLPAPSNSGQGGPAKGSLIEKWTKKGRTVSLVGDVYRFLATGEDTNCKYAHGLAADGS
jgi:hypothetical protein